MSFAEPISLGIIACPGAEEFSRQIIRNMKNLYRRWFDKKAKVLARRYDQPLEDIFRQLNLAADMRTSRLSMGGPVGGYRPPDFLLNTKFTRFANGELKAELPVSVRGMDIYIIQDVENHYPLRVGASTEAVKFSVNDHLCCLFVTIDAVIQAGARKVSVVLPTYPYSRQHEKKGRESLSASLFGHILEDLGVSRLVTLDIHSKEIDNSFRTLRLDNLHASYQILRTLSTVVDLHSPDLVVLAPDSGAIGRNKYFASNLKSAFSVLYKERDYSRLSASAKESNITSIRLLGDVRGKTVFMADDMLGTGGTLINAMRTIKEEHGAGRIVCAISLPLFTGAAIEHFEEAYREGLIYRVIGTNAVYHDKNLLEREWYLPANVAPLFARTIMRLHHNLSLSSILDNSKVIQRLLAER